MSHWFVCLTKPRQEAKAERNLLEQGYEVYVPMLARWIRKNGAWRLAQQSMFPRYGFVRCGRAGQSIAPIRSTPGVQDLVRFGTRPATLADPMVAAIRELAEHDQQAWAANATPFTPGMRIVVVDGPLKGLTGLVSEVAEQRIAVLMTLLGQEQRIVIPTGQLAPGEVLSGG